MSARRILKACYTYFILFLVIAYVVTCCTMLFVTTMSKTMEIELTKDMIADAAKVTMLNVILLTFLLSICDVIRRRITVERPARKILEAGKKLTSGDFSVRIPSIKPIGSQDEFSEIAECFNKMAEELSSIETLRTDFVANVSHELKTPLSVMQNYGSLLSQPELEDEKRIEYAKEITDASRRLVTLIANVLKLNKLENQQIAPMTERYNLSEQICECLLGFEDAWMKKELNIETDVEDDIYIFSDSEMMSIVWNNLISNAIKFTGNGGTVSVALKSDGKFAAVSIRDTGCGISENVGKHIFDKFYQGDTSHATDGNGLGLALVKRVVDITESGISVKSEIGKGTVFTVRVRRADNEL